MPANGAELPLGDFRRRHGGGEIIGRRRRRRSFFLDQSVEIPLEFKLEIFSESRFSFLLALFLIAGESFVEFGRLFVHGEIGVWIFTEIVGFQRF